MVSIVAFQAVDPGSIPGRRRNSFVGKDSLEECCSTSLSDEIAYEAICTNQGKQIQFE